VSVNVKVPNHELRQAFDELEVKQGLSLGEVAARMGWMTKDKGTGKLKGDSSRVARVLGKVKDGAKARTEINEAYAIALCRAMHVDPIDVGL
jgi:hypothetical protein